MKNFVILFAVFCISNVGQAAHITKIYPKGNRTLASKGEVVGVRLLTQKGNKKVKTNDFEKADLVQVIGQRSNEGTWFYCKLSKDLISSKGISVRELVTHLNGRSTNLRCEEFDKGGFAADDFQLTVFGADVLNKEI